MTEELTAPQGTDPEKEAARQRLMEKYGGATKKQPSPSPTAAIQTDGKEEVRQRLIDKYGAKPAEAPAPEVPPFLQAPPQQAAVGGASSITQPTTPPAPTPQPAPAGGPDWSKYQGPNTSLPQELKPVVTDGADDMGDTFLTADTKKNAEAVLFTYRNDFSPQAVRDKAKAKETLEGIEAADAYAKEEMMRVKKEILPQRVNTLRGMEQGFAEDKRAFEEAVAALQAKVPQYQQAVAQDPTQADAINAQYQQELQGIRSMEDMLKKQASVAQAYAKSVEADRIMAEGYDYLLRSRQGTFGGATWNNLLASFDSANASYLRKLIPAIVRMVPEGALGGMTPEEASKELTASLVPDVGTALGDMAGDTGTTKEYVQKMQDTFLGGAWLGGTGSLPLALYGPGGIGMMLSASEGVRKQMDDPSFADIPDWKKDVFADGVGFVIGQLERLGIKEAFGGGTMARRILTNAIDKLPRNATNAQFKAVLAAETESAAANFAARIAGSGVSEYGVEAGQAVAEATMMDIFNKAEEKNLLAREDGSKGFDTPASLGELMTDAHRQGLQGMLFGGVVMGTPSAVYKHMQDRSVGKTTNDAQFELTESLLKDKEFVPTMEADLEAKVEAGTITPTQAEETKAAWKEAQTVIAKIPDDLPTEKKREAFDLLTEKQQLSKLDKSMVGDRIMKVDEKLSKVAGVPDVKAETKEWSGKEVEPKAKPSPAPAPAETPAPVAEAKVVADEPRQENVVESLTQTQPEDGGIRTVGDVEVEQGGGRSEPMERTGAGRERRTDSPRATRLLSEFEIRPSSDDVRTVAEANDLTITRTNEEVDISALDGGVDLRQPSERRRVDKLKEKILSDEGYVARLIIDGQGNVVEGQHRLDALRELGFDKAPVVRLTGISDYIKDREGVVAAMKRVGLGRTDQHTQMIGIISEIIADEKGDVSALKEYDAPQGYEAAWDAAVNEVIRQSQPTTIEDGGQAEAGDLAGQEPAIGQVDTPVDGGGTTAAVDGGAAAELGPVDEVVRVEPVATPEEQPAKVTEAAQVEAELRVVDEGAGGFRVEAIADGRKVGQAIFDGRGYVAAIDVDEDMMRKGVGASMMKALGAEAKKRGHKRLGGLLEGSGTVRLREKVFGSGNTKYYTGKESPENEVSVEDAIQINEVDYGALRAVTDLRGIRPTPPPAPKPKAPKKAQAKKAAPKVEEAPAPTPAPKVAEAAKPTATPMSFKREGQAPVAEPVIVSEKKDVVGPEGVKGRQREYIYPGLEEYRLITAKVKGGYKVYEATSKIVLNINPQPNEDLALADASESVDRFGKQKLDSLIEKGLEPKVKLSEKIASLKIDTSKLGGMTFSVPLPVSPKLIAQAINVAIDTVAAGVRAAENLSAVLGKARKEFQNNDWYKKLDTAGKQRANAVFRDRVARPITALATDEEKPKKSKVQRQANKATGVTKEKNLITVDERVALKEKLRGLSKAASGAVRQYRSASKDFSGAVKTAMKPLRAKLGGNKVAAIANAALKVNPTDQLKVERFLQYVDNVIAKANYADDLAKARKAQKKAVKALKSKTLERNHKEAIRALADVDIDGIDDLVEYTAYVNEYADVVKSPASDKYKQLDSRRAIEFAKSLYAQEEKAYVNALLSEFGVESSSAEARAIYEAILSDKTSDEAMQDLAAKAKEKAIMLADRMRTMAVSRSSILNSEIKDGNLDMSGFSDMQKKIVSYLAMAEPSNMSTEAHASYIRAVDNLLVSGSLHGAMRAAVQAKASAATLQAAKLMEGHPVMRLFSKGLAKETMSFSDIFTFFFGGRGGAWDRVQQVMGIGNFYTSKKKWADQVIEVERKMTDFYNNLNKQYSSSNDAPHKIAEFIAATLIQRMPGIGERESVSMNKDLILQDIEKKDGLDGYSKHVTLARSVFDAVFKEAKTIEDVFSSLKKSYPAAEKSVKFMTEVSKQYRELFEQMSELTYNDPGDYTDPNYITRPIMPAPGDPDISDMGGPRVMRRDTIRPTRAKGTIQRQVYWRLPDGYMFNWDLRQAVLKNLSSNLYDAIVAPAQMEVGAFMDSAESKRVFGSKDNVSFVKGQMSSYFKSEFRKLEGLEGVVDKFTNGARNMMVPMALGGITQPIKQYPEAMAQAVIMNGALSPQRLARAVAANMTGSANDLLNQFAIGSRAGIQGGTNWSGRIATELDAFNAAIANNIVDKASKHYTKAQQIFMWALSKSDAAAAKTAWLALYEKRRNEQGHKVLSWSQEAEMLQRDEQRMQSALYAEGSIDTFMVSSDPAKVAKIAKRDAGFGNFVKAMFFALTGYSFQSLSRKVIDASILWSYTKRTFSGDPSRKYLDTAGALRSQLASITGAAVYGASSILVFQLKDYLAEQFVSIFDDDDEEAALKYIAVLHALYMLRIPVAGDTDVFGSSQIAAANLIKARKAGMTYADYMAANRDDTMSDKLKQIYTRLMLETVGLGVSQEGFNFLVDTINKQYYKALVKAGDRSVMTKKGRPMAYEYWIKDPTNTLIARPGQGWNSAWELGIFGMMMSNAERVDKMLPEYINAFSDDKQAAPALPTPPRRISRPE